MTGFLLGYIGLLVFGCGILVAFVFLAARKTKAARIVFAVGLLLATVILAIAVLTFLQKEYHGDEHPILIVLAALSLLLAGAGPFVGALRSPRSYGAALACTAASIAFLTAPMLGAEAVSRIPGLRFLTAPGLVLWPWPSLLLAVASWVVAVLFPFHAQHPEPLSLDARGPT